MPTSTAHHYLALVLKTKLNNDLKKSKKKPFGRPFTSPRTSAYQRYPMQDYRQPRFDLSETKDTRAKIPFHDQKVGKGGQKQLHTGNQRESTHSGLCGPLDFVTSGGATAGNTDCWEQRKQHYEPYTTTAKRRAFEDKQEGEMEDPQRDFSKTRTSTTVIRYIVKCPTKVFPYPKGDARVNEVLHHLDQAIILGENRGAVYDKGLILRATQDFDEAISTFQSLIKEETSLMYLANAYEQCAFCFQSQLEHASVDLETKRKLTHDRKKYLMASVAISTKMVARMPNITKIWDARTTLKDILIGEGKPKENLKELALLSERLKDYQDAIAYYIELQRLAESEQGNSEILMKIVQNQMADGNFIEAVSVFDLILMTPNGKKCIDEKLYLSALIEAGFEGIRKKSESNVGSGYLKAVINHSLGWYEADPKAGRKNEESSYQISPETDETFDVFILCNENDTRTVRKAKQMIIFLQVSCNLKATLNKEDVVPGLLELSAMLTFISHSPNVVVCLDKTTLLKGELQMGVEHAAREKTNIAVVLMDARARIPDCLMRFPSILYEIGDEVAEIEWMKSLFYKVAKC